MTITIRYTYIAVLFFIVVANNQQDEHMEKKSSCLHNRSVTFFFCLFGCDWAMEVDYPDQGSLPLTFPWVPEGIKDTHLTFADHFLTKTQYC